MTKAKARAKAKLKTAPKPKPKTPKPKPKKPKKPKTTPKPKASKAKKPRPALDARQRMSTIVVPLTRNKFVPAARDELPELLRKVVEKASFAAYCASFLADMHALRVVKGDVTPLDKKPILTRHFYEVCMQLVGNFTEKNRMRADTDYPGLLESYGLAFDGATEAVAKTDRDLQNIRAYAATEMATAVKNYDADETVAQHMKMYIQAKYRLRTRALTAYFVNLIRQPFDVDLTEVPERFKKLIKLQAARQLVATERALYHDKSSILHYRYMMLQEIEKHNNKAILQRADAQAAEASAQAEAAEASAQAEAGANEADAREKEDAAMDEDEEAGANEADAREKEDAAMDEDEDEDEDDEGGDKEGDGDEGDVVNGGTDEAAKMSKVFSLTPLRSMGPKFISLDIQSLQNIWKDASKTQKADFAAWKEQSEKGSLPEWLAILDDLPPDVDPYGSPPAPVLEAHEMTTLEALGLALSALTAAEDALTLTQAAPPGNDAKTSAARAAKDVAQSDLEFAAKTLKSAKSLTTNWPFRVAFSLACNAFNDADAVSWAESYVNAAMSFPHLLAGITAWTTTSTTAAEGAETADAARPGHPDHQTYLASRAETARQALEAETMWQRGSASCLISTTDAFMAEAAIAPYFDQMLEDHRAGMGPPDPPGEFAAIAPYFDQMLEDHRAGMGPPDPPGEFVDASGMTAVVATTVAEGTAVRPDQPTDFNAVGALASSAVHEADPPDPPAEFVDASGMTAVVTPTVAEGTAVRPDQPTDFNAVGALASSAVHEADPPDPPAESAEGSGTIDAAQTDPHAVEALPETTASTRDVEDAAATDVADSIETLTPQQVAREAITSAFDSIEEFAMGTFFATSRTLARVSAKIARDFAVNWLALMLGNVDWLTLRLGTDPGNPDWPTPETMDLPNEVLQASALSVAVSRALDRAEKAMLSAATTIATTLRTNDEINAARVKVAEAREAVAEARAAAEAEGFRDLQKLEGDGPWETHSTDTAQGDGVMEMADVDEAMETAGAAQGDEAMEIAGAAQGDDGPWETHSTDTAQGDGVMEMADVDEALEMAGAAQGDEAMETADVAHGEGATAAKPLSRGKNWVLGRIFRTNGYELHIMFEKNAPRRQGRLVKISEGDKCINQDYDPEYEWENATPVPGTAPRPLPGFVKPTPRLRHHFAAADVGVHNVVTAVSPRDCETNFHGQPLMEVRNYSLKKFNFHSKRKAVNKKVARIKKVGGQDLKQREAELAADHPKTANQEQLQRAINVRRKHYEKIYEYYGSHQLLRLKTTARMAEQRTIDELCHWITWGGTKPLGWGDCSKTTGIRGAPPSGPVRRIRRHARKKGYDITLVNEAYTSKRACCCRGANLKPARRNGKSIHGVRLCPTCGSPWDRDVSAGINIFEIYFYHTIWGRGRPSHLQPAPTNTDDPVA